MNLCFWKMHGAGNDFLLFDDRNLSFPARDSAFVARLCDRRRGVGAEGVVLIQPPSSNAHFRMRFFNPDGSEADMCGNGARCVARLASELRAAPDDMLVETPAGILRAEIIPRAVRIHLSPPKDWRPNLSISWNGRSWVFHHLNSGVPHAVCFVDDLSALDVPAFGSFVRRHPLFSPAGANVDFAQVSGPAELAVRTFERGVEAETLACGTGIAASAIVAARLGLLGASSVRVRSAGGDVLEVGLAPPTLAGPAEHVFRGEMAYRQ